MFLAMVKSYVAVSHVVCPVRDSPDRKVDFPHGTREGIKSREVIWVHISAESRGPDRHTKLSESIMVGLFNRRVSHATPLGYTDLAP